MLTRGYCEDCDSYYQRYMLERMCICPKCGRVTKSVKFTPQDDPFINKKLGDHCSVDSQMIENIRYSRTLSVPESQIKDAAKLHPGVDWKKFGNRYRPVIHNRNEKLKIIKQRQMMEYD